ncbi:MAG: hypothetical protein R3E10_12045 [Gemmatimonadota bacterium]
MSVLPGAWVASTPYGRRLPPVSDALRASAFLTSAGRRQVLLPGRMEHGAAEGV